MSDATMPLVPRLLILRSGRPLAMWIYADPWNAETAAFAHPVAEGDAIVQVDDAMTMAEFQSLANVPIDPDDPTAAEVIRELLGALVLDVTVPAIAHDEATEELWYVRAGRADRGRIEVRPREADPLDTDRSAALRKLVEKKRGQADTPAKTPPRVGHNFAATIAMAVP